MKLRKFGWLVFWALLANAGAQTAYSQGPPPPPPPPGTIVAPTLPPTPTAPAARALPKGTFLLKKMKAAEKKAGSYHFVLRMRIGEGKSGFLTDFERGDVSARHDRQHVFYTEIFTKKPHARSIVSRSESIEAGNLSASRRPGGKWNCVDYSRKPRGGGFGLTEPQVQLTAFRPHLHEIKNVGPMVIGDVVVWHVHAKSSFRKTYRFSGVHIPLVEKGSYDFYISQGHGRLRRQVSSDMVRLQTVLSWKSTEDRSFYGKHFHITLPCSKFKAPPRENGAPLLPSLAGS